MIESVIELLSAKLLKIGSFDKKIRVDMGEHIVVIDGYANPPTLSLGEGEADVSALMSVEHFADLLAGKLHPQLALMSGKIKVKGDMLSALPLIKLL
jgi:putative sterol carrier protein